MADEDEAKRAALRAYQNEWQRIRQRKREQSGVCTVCGGKHGPIGGPDTYKGMCLTCTEMYRRRTLLYRMTQPVTARPKSGWRRKVSVRVCRHCKGRNLVTSGPLFSSAEKSVPKRERYLCLDCKKWSYGKALPPAPEFLCPYCKGLCSRAGRQSSGRQLYKCRACGRTNTNLFPAARPDQLGSFRRVVSFVFGPLGGKALTEYCNHHRMPASKALRTILREAATPLVPVMATAQREWPLGGRRQVSHVRLRSTEPQREPLRDVPLSLPNIRSQVNRERMKSPAGSRHRPVAAEFRVPAYLDALAWEGLIRTMRWRGVTHQEAMRQLLLEAWRRLT
ncbi:MAG: hypothetical protein V4671_19970 [Armatimonadota bacterium]